VKKCASQQTVIRSKPTQDTPDHNIDLDVVEALHSKTSDKGKWEGDSKLIKSTPTPVNNALGVVRVPAQQV